MNVYQILDASKSTLSQRGAENGYDQQEERSAADVAALFNQKTGHNLTEADAWQFLICLKEVRLKKQLLNGSDPSDTLVDLISYNGLLAECLLKGE